MGSEADAGESRKSGTAGTVGWRVSGRKKKTHPRHGSYARTVRGAATDRTGECDTGLPTLGSHLIRETGIHSTNVTTMWKLSF